MHSQQHALEAGSAVPENGDVQNRGNGLDVWDQESSNGVDSQVSSAAAQAFTPKIFATLQARAALVGATLTEIPDDTGRPELILSRWALTRAFRDLDELEATLDRMGAPR